MKSRSILLVTVVGPGGQQDVAMAADVPVFRLMPALAALVGGGQGNWEASAAARWHLRAGDRICAPSRTLAEAGVADGNELHVASGPRSQGDRTTHA
jgi:hypothetical protein